MVRANEPQMIESTNAMMSRMLSAINISLGSDIPFSAAIFFCFMLVIITQLDVPVK